MNVRCLLASVLLVKTLDCAVFIGCPENLTTYLGCNKTVTALLDISSNGPTSCSNYKSTVQLKNLNIEYSPTPSPIPGTQQCIISITFSVLQFFYDVLFVAVLTEGALPTSICCEDLIKVHSSVPPPNITNTSVNCSGGLVEWVAPELEDGSEVAHYTLWIKRPNITHELTNSTRMMVPFDGLMYNEEYEFSVYASHCGRKGESAFGTIRTAMVPQVMNHTNVFIEKKNLSHITVTLISKVISTGCSVAYPTAVSVVVTCNQQEISDSSRKVFVASDGSIVFKLDVPVDHAACNGTLLWQNRYYDFRGMRVMFDTNQLKSCTFAVKRNKITFSCVFSNFSRLQGCIVSATQIVNGYQLNYTVRADTSGVGAISDVCDGVYSVTCVGIVDASSTINYSGSQYSTELSVTSAPDCKRSSTTSLSPSLSSSPVIISHTPSTLPVHGGMSTSLMIGTVFAILIVLLIGTLSVLFGVVIWWRRRVSRHTCMSTSSNGVQTKENNEAEKEFAQINEDTTDGLMLTDPVQATEEREKDRPLNLKPAGNYVKEDNICDHDDDKVMETLPQNKKLAEFKNRSGIDRQSSENVLPLSAKLQFLTRRSMSLKDEVVSKPKTPMTESEIPLLELSSTPFNSTEVDEHSVAPPSDETPVNAGFVGNRNPSIPSGMGTSMVSGRVSDGGRGHSSRATDSEHRHLLSNTSEHHDYSEQHPPETEEDPRVIVVNEQQRASYHGIAEKKSEDDAARMMVSRSRDEIHVPVVTQYTGSNMETQLVQGQAVPDRPTSSSETTTDDDRRGLEHMVTQGSPRRQLSSDCSESFEQKKSNNENTQKNSDIFALPKSDSQYSVHQPHEEEGSKEHDAFYTFVPYYAEKKT